MTGYHCRDPKKKHDFPSVLSVIKKNQFFFMEKKEFSLHTVNETIISIKNNGRSGKK